MGIGSDFGTAYAKAQLGAGQNLPTEGTVFISVIDNDKKTVLPVAAKYRDAGFKIMATHGTSKFLADIRRNALRYKVPYATTTAGGMAIYKAIEALRKKKTTVKTVQEYNSEVQR